MSSVRAESGAKTHSVERKTQRLFFALWPDEAVRKQLTQCQQSKCFSNSLSHHGGSRAVFPGNFHMTLAFLGNVDTDQKACVEQVANGLQCSPFKLTINNVDYWRKPRILWIGPDEMPDVLATLAMELRDGAIECGVQMDMRPYRAHVTLMRKVARAPTEMEIMPFVWAAKRFVLVKSTTFSEGVRYEVVREWELEG